MMRVMQSSPFVQCMVKVGCARQFVVVAAGSCQGTCVGARAMAVGGQGPESGRLLRYVRRRELRKRGRTNEPREKMEGAAEMHINMCPDIRTNTHTNTLTTTPSHPIIIIMQV